MVGVISSIDWKGETTPKRVSIEPFGNVLKLRLCTEPRKYAGMITVPALRKLHEKHSVHLAGTLFPPKTTDAKGKNAESDADPMVHVLVYGNRDDKDSIGACLNEGDVFLQHPITAPFDPRITYLNPNYLVRPGGKGPELGEVVALGEDQEPETARSISSAEKNKVMQIFDSAMPETGTYSAIKQSQRLSTTLKEYQLVALSVMVERETSRVHDLKFPSLWRPVKGSSGYRNNITGVTQDNPTPLKGGILADEMGLGKTLSLLSLVCFSLDTLDERGIPDSHPRATLVIAPKSTIPAWEHQIKKHIQPGQVRYVVYHGTKREGVKQPFNRNYDIVITTYETLHHDSKADNKLRDEKWYRVVLDEAHRIRNRASAQFKAAAELNSYYRWCLTGTPIQNSLDDYCALLAFLQVETFREKRLFDYWIAGPMERKGARGVNDLKILVAATCLRRTKNMVEDAVELPGKSEVIEPIQLAPAEREIYEFFQRKASKIMVRLDQPEQCERKNNTLSIINNMRVICNHGEDLLPESQVAIWNDHKKAKEDTSLSPERVEGLSLPSPGGVHCNFNTGSNRPSTKVQALLKNLEKEQRASGKVSPKLVKSVVFSQWTKMLDLVGDALRGCNYEFARIDGGSSLSYRSDALQRFNENGNCTVMLASTRSAAEGIDMTAASFVHILEPHWNPKLEDQAIARVHRIGQSRNVLVTKYLVQNSIEDYVRWLQDDKNWITQISLAGTDVELSSLDLDCQRREKLQQVFTLT
ncbi:hypothetical protein ASPVEDRAFT_508057 [Aspergillus versicolor CBS 583.65]|uniref:Helicase ATP-binding domain-containing protein n=1 Tax=Aspergillus versicolor CBS 583.65 TaxID=1036611 RepID=A0A1L9PCL9_ASPVE|nr:uncharacterized protein ASPVEDRAFT_508057 [Aspergillus versicolor CBS 583.65]OJI99277.1 hypothetical protein ASPVEDRAFT_508057 [Aspergillus versicolor CBS 583.65]